MVAVVNIRKFRLPMSVKAMTIPDENGEFNIYINDRLSDAAADKAYEHEMEHISAEDFNKDMPGHILK